MSLFNELKRRNIFKVAVTYVLVAWLLLQVSDTLVPALRLPEWFHSGVAFVLILGFPVALLLAWAYEMTPEGLRREQDVERGEAPSTPKGRRLNYLLIAALALVVAYFAYDNFPGKPGDAEPAQPASEVAAVPPAADGGGSRREVLPNSVAVLPLENLSLNPEDAFFAAGIHDELLNQLAKIRDLNVIARTSVLAYADRERRSIPEIAEELKVQAVMEGTVRYGGDRVRITAQLIDGNSGTHLWSQTYESAFDAENVFAIESDIAMQIAAALEAELLPAERASIEKIPTASTQALTLYLKAKTAITDMGPFMPAEEVAAFHGYLDQALEADPGFALAHAWKAYEYGFALSRTFPLEDVDAMARREALVLKHAQTALELDPDLGFAHAALAWPHTFAVRREASLAAWGRAYELSPGDPDIVTDFSYIASASGRIEQALSLARQAREMAPNSAPTLAVTAFASIFAGDREQALELQQRAMALDPAFFFPYLQIGLLKVTLGKPEEAPEHLAMAERLSRGIPSPDVLSHLAYGYGRSGRPEDALRIFRRIEEMASGYHVGAASWAMACLGVGDEARALTSLLAAGEAYGGEGYLALTYLAGNAFDDPRLEQPEFVEARRRLGLRIDL